MEDFITGVMLDMGLVVGIDGGWKMECYAEQVMTVSGWIQS